MMAHETVDPVVFEEILGYLKEARGFDFTAYKHASLQRRILRRMQMLDVPSLIEYRDYLRRNPAEFSGLLDTILINVTSFFRDREVWNAIDEEIIPALIRRRGAEGSFRIWSAGCASGQEPFGIAMLFAEHLGLERLHERVKIYATDVDEHALGEARRAVYPLRQMESVPPRCQQYFGRPENDHAAVVRELRRAVIFGRLDLLRDPPISRIDLLLCRNTLMYFTQPAKAAVMAKLYYATHPEGTLIVGRAEMLFSHVDLFVPGDLKRRMFRPQSRAMHRQRFLLTPPARSRRRV